MVTVREPLRAHFNSNRRKLATSHSTCVIRKKAHSLETLEMPPLFPVLEGSERTG
jgi:hypothetical protein